MFKQAVVFLSLFCVAFAAVAGKKPITFEGKGCYVSEVGGVIPYGESAPSKTGCRELHCKANGSLIGRTCGLSWMAPPCYMVEDPSLPYPACCPAPRCP